MIAIVIRIPTITTILTNASLALTNRNNNISYQNTRFISLSRNNDNNNNNN